MSARGRGGWVILFLALAGCELTEVAAPAGEDVLVVESILRVGARQQYAILHRSLEGRVIRGEPGAIVTVTTPDGEAVRFGEVNLRECLVNPPVDWNIDDLEVLATCYASPAEAGRFVRPGGTYDLRVETGGGASLRGRTTVPGSFALTTPAVHLDSATLAVRCLLPRERFPLTWTRSSGAWAYLATLWLTEWGQELRDQGVEVPDPLELTGVSVSASDTTILFPSNLGLFQRFDYDQRVLLALQQGLPPGAGATVVVLAADRNYTNSIRGGRFNPSGNVRASSLIGDGVGVFGSVVPLTIRSPSASATDLPAPCPMPPT